DNKVAELNRLALDWWRKHPEAARNGLSLGNLQEFVNKLGGKADYTIINHDATRGAGFALAVAEKIVDDYEKDRPHREKQNFDDLLRALWDALKAENGQDLARKLRQDFKAALIDEFQDTDPVQYDIFRRVFLEGELPLFFVGDPKQAIYSFRGGDIFTYMKACAIPGLKKHDLNTNFRSTRHLMEAINGLFKDEQDENGVHYTFSSSDIDYPGTVQVLQEPKIKGPDLEQPFRIIKISDEITGTADKHAEIRSLLVKQILGILSEKDENGKPIFTPKDIAVLMNSHSQEDALQKELRRLGVPSVIAKSGNVFATPAAYELSAFLEAILQPYGMVLRRGLATVFGGAPAEDIASSDSKETMAEYVKLFKELGEAWQKRGFYALMAKLEGLGYKTRIAAREDGERMLTDMAQLLELCFATAKKIGPSTEKLLDWLDDCIRQASSKQDDSEEFMRELEKDGDTVKIMTIHVSKGLQFPIVFLPECWNLMSQYDPRNKFPLPYYHQESGERKLVFELEVDKKGAKKKNSAAEKKAKEELLHEKMRLLYVAMTRAIQRTILITPSVDATKEPLGYLLGKAENVPSIQWLEADDIQDSGIFRYRQVLEQAQQSKEALPPAKFKLLPTKGSYSSLSPSAKENDNEDGRDDDSLDNGQRRQGETEFTLPIFNMPCGMRIGTCWHNILEKIPFDASDEKLSQIAAGELGNSGFAAEGELLQTTVDMLRKVLEHALTSPSGEQFKLSQIGWEQRLSEQEFDFSSAEAVKTTKAISAIIKKHWKDNPAKADFLKAMEDWDKPVPNGFFNGFIDLIFQKGDFFYIVDWKSNILDSKKESFNESGIRKEMAKHGYFLQYLLYSAVLHRYMKETMGDAYSWQHNFGGIRYFFLRGVAAESPAPVFEDRPSEA
ncbi:MAG: UvrD-helicase domain-containing protein, partial [Victivallales bacterium]|nr:UvrD-helicase domain-containing protein [Victivallales bacterium]